MPKNNNLSLFLMCFVTLIIVSCAREKALSINNLTSNTTDSLEITFKGLGKKTKNLPDYDKTYGERIIDACPYWENDDSICYYLNNWNEDPRKLWNLKAIETYFYKKIPVEYFQIQPVSEKITRKDLSNSCHNFKIYREYLSTYETLSDTVSPLTRFSVKIAPGYKITFRCDIVGDRSCNVQMSDFSDTVVFRNNNKTKVFKSSVIDSILFPKSDFFLDNLNLKIEN